MVGLGTPGEWGVRVVVRDLAESQLVLIGCGTEFLGLISVLSFSTFWLLCMNYL